MHAGARCPFCHSLEDNQQNSVLHTMAFVFNPMILYLYDTFLMLLIYDAVRQTCI